MENDELPFVAFRGIGGPGEEIRDPLLREGRRGDDIVKVLHEGPLCQDREAFGNAGADINAALPDDPRIVWRPAVHKSDETAEFSQAAF